MFSINGGPVLAAGTAVHHLVLQTRDHISPELWLSLLLMLLLQWLLAATGNHSNTKGHKHLHHCMPEFPGTWSCDSLWQCRKSKLTCYSNLNGLLSTLCTQAQSCHYSLRTYVPWQNTALVQKKDIPWWDCEATVAILFFTELAGQLEFQTSTSQQAYFKSIFPHLFNIYSMCIYTHQRDTRWETVTVPPQLKALYNHVTLEGWWWGWYLTALSTTFQTVPWEPTTCEWFSELHNVCYHGRRL